MRDPLTFKLNIPYQVMKRQNLFSLLLFSTCILGWMACSNENDDLTENKKNYTFSSILWKLGEGDGIETIAHEIPEEIFRNKGSEAKQICVTPLKSINETSIFQFENTEDFNKWVGEDLLVYVPFYLEGLSSEYSNCIGIERVPLFAGKEFELHAAPEMKDCTKLPPNLQLSYKATIYLKKITATCLIRFVEEKNKNDYVEIEGKWTGILFKNMESHTAFQEIK